jgi:hypothetical protein
MEPLDAAWSILKMWAGLLLLACFLVAVSKQKITFDAVGPFYCGLLAFVGLFWIPEWMALIGAPDQPSAVFALAIWCAMYPILLFWIIGRRRGWIVPLKGN